MKDHESYREIEDLLRGDKPRVTPPPGLEARILVSIETSERAMNRRWWPWLFVPAAAAIGIVMLRPLHQQKQSPAAKIEPPRIERPLVETSHIEVFPVEAAVNEVALEEGRLASFFENPLARETRALKRDARRAGHFLIRALPSLSVEAE